MISTFNHRFPVLWQRHYWQSHLLWDIVLWNGTLIQTRLMTSRVLCQTQSMWIKLELNEEALWLHPNSNPRNVWWDCCFYRLKNRKSTWTIENHTHIQAGPQSRGSEGGSAREIEGDHVIAAVPTRRGQRTEDRQSVSNDPRSAFPLWDRDISRRDVFSQILYSLSQLVCSWLREPRCAARCRRCMKVSGWAPAGAQDALITLEMCFTHRQLPIFGFMDQPLAKIS